MKVLTITLDFLPNSGGIAVFLHNLCIQLSCLGHQVDVLKLVRKIGEEADARQPYHVYRYVSWARLSSVVPIRHTLALHRQHHYDVVFIGHFMTTHSLGALALSKLWGVPYVILSHGNDLTYSIFTRTDRIVGRWLLRNAEMMMGNSRFTAKLISKTGYKGHIEILNPGVDQGRFCPEVDTTEVRKQYSLDGRKVLLTVSRLVAKKNVDAVLHALPKVIKHVPNVLFLIAGDGGERENLERLTDKLEVQRHVRFLGHIKHDHLPALYCASNLFVMPSYASEQDRETFGISFIEANACGLPVIAAQSSGMNEAVVEGETALLVDPFNIDEIATAIIRLLTNRELAQRLGANGRRRVEQEFSWEKVGKRLESYLSQVVKRA